jgi:tRNA1Val (adenine37-N6)-methyltransferase
MPETFAFKQFSIEQDQCAMKIGTDSVLLGAWASITSRPDRILDIGAGTGVLSLMLAQRSSAHTIDAIEIDAGAYEQCSENFEHSPWADRMFCYHASLLEFVEELSEGDMSADAHYDLIICNPPFYAGTHKSEDKTRNLARFQDAMPFEHLVYAADHLISKEGVFATIIPYQEEQQLIKLAAQAQLFPRRCLHIKGHPGAEIKRSLLEFCRVKQPCKSTVMIIETARHMYTEDYVNLTKDFYLKM